MFIISKDNYKNAIKEVNKELKNVSYIMMGKLSTLCERVEVESNEGLINILLYINDKDFINKSYRGNNRGLQVGDISIDTDEGESLKVEFNANMDALEFTLLTEEYK